MSGDSYQEQKFFDRGRLSKSIEYEPDYLRPKASANAMKVTDVYSSQDFSLTPQKIAALVDHSYLDSLETGNY